MKILIATALTMVSLSAFSADFKTVDSFLSILPLGQYEGVNDLKENCSVSVYEVNFPSKSISVVVESPKNKIFKKINDGTPYVLRGYRQEFIQTDRYYIDSTRNTYVESIVRTVNAEDNKLYIVVAHETTINGSMTTRALDCVITK